MTRFSADASHFNEQPWRRDLEFKMVKAALRGTDRGALGARDDQRSAMRAQRLGGLSNAIKQTSDLKLNRIHGQVGGRWSVSGIVYAHIRSERTRGALDAYTQGASIIPRKGRWLAIATDQIPKRVGRFKMTPERYIEGGFEARIGPLKFVPTSRAGIAYLVVEKVNLNTRRSGSAVRRPRRGSSEAGIVAFVLIKATRRNKRISVDQIMFKWQAKTPQLISEAYNAS